eukprot:Gregarina_sp_Poly_1__9500@NODE_597_length_7261_cov_402_527940_g461_i0_p8_GENE_NODE_597_length_7261_cov_402_527940_g461_i0NODE_597_length_7261_cov_402_527940_g461_i0_p8_ORF_typecomplete_len111_score13_52Asp/PF00026_23/3_9e10_NODE_597_length_7261_cov_402_527940_g461_i017602092
MASQKVLEYSRFAFFFPKNPAMRGSVSFGAIDPKMAASITDKPAVIPLVSTKYWEVGIIGIKIGNKYLEACSLDPEGYLSTQNTGRLVATDDLDQYCAAAIDTGSSLITV